MSKVNIKVLPSSVIFSQGKREVTLSKKHLPLISGVISATSNRGLASMGIARKKEFTSLAIPAGFKGRNKLLECAKDSADFAVSKGLLQKKGMIYRVATQLVISPKGLSFLSMIPMTSRRLLRKSQNQGESESQKTPVNSRSSVSATMVNWFA